MIGISNNRISPISVIADDEYDRNKPHNSYYSVQSDGQWIKRIGSIDNEFVVRAKVDAKSGIIYDTGYRISADSVDVVVVTCI